MILTEHPIVFSNAKKRILTSIWITHTPFAFFLTSILRPEVYVELGVDEGQSYHAVCQAVNMLKTGTRCYGIDLWSNSDNIFSEINEYNYKEYNRFSCLLKTTSDEGGQHFQDGTVDLLHINGEHTYEAAKNNFETWLPKMSDKGVVIFHNSFIKDAGYGVWKLWAEVSIKYPSFEIYHGCGLGVIAVGEKVENDFIEFIRDKEMHDFYRKFFFKLGQNVQTLAVNDQLKGEINQLRTHHDYLSKYYNRIEELIPKNSFRRKLVVNSIKAPLKMYSNVKKVYSNILEGEKTDKSFLEEDRYYYKETLYSINSLPVPLPGSPKRRCAIFVMVKDENIFLPIWLKYYTQFFNSEDIYVFDHNTVDDSITECKKNFEFNVIPLSYPYSFDHEWFKFVANKTQQKLLESYEYVVFTDIDEIILPDTDKYKGLDDYINQIQSDYVQCRGYDIIHLEKNEPDFDNSKTVLSQRKFWYSTSWYNKTLISRRPLNWEIGFHEVRDVESSIDNDLFLIHLHKLDFKKCWQKSFERARLRWSQSDVFANRGWQNRITDIDEFRFFYYGWPDEIEITEIPVDLRNSDAF